jgi:hypothetical protein
MNSSLDTPTVKSNYQSQIPTSAWIPCEKFKNEADDRLSVRNSESQRTQHRNTCTSIFPLLVKIIIERLRPLPSTVLKTREEVLDTLTIVTYFPHASIEDNVRVTSHNWTRMGEILTGHTLP